MAKRKARRMDMVMYEYKGLGTQDWCFGNPKQVRYFSPLVHQQAYGTACTSWYDLGYCTCMYRF
jgi:hypothetical protein